MARGSNVTKFHKRPTLNVGVIIFIVIFIYLIISVIIFMTSKKTVIFDVYDGSLAVDYNFTGLILRDETIVNSENSGYVDYFIKNKRKAAFDTIICSIDETGRVSELINSTSDDALDDECKNFIKKSLIQLSREHKDNIFNNTYYFDENIERTIFESQSEKSINMLDEYIKQTDNASFFHKVIALKPGLISYIVDKYNNTTETMLSKSDFDSSDYIETNLVANKIINENDPIYKIINSENWNVYFLLDDNQYNSFKDKTSVKVTFTDVNITTECDFSIINQGEEHIGKLSLDKYMINFSDERYVSVKITTISPSGLKIPVSSVFQRNAFAIPREYLANNNSFIIRDYKPNGDIGFKTVQPTFLYSDADNYYVSTDDFKSGDVVVKESSEDVFIVGILKELDGVYCVNKGYAAFKAINILDKNKEYYIISKNTDYSLSKYDHIVLDYTTISESQLTQ